MSYFKVFLNKNPLHCSTSAKSVPLRQHCMSWIHFKALLLVSALCGSEVTWASLQAVARHSLSAIYGQLQAGFQVPWGTQSNISARYLPRDIQSKVDFSSYSYISMGLKLTLKTLASINIKIRQEMFCIMTCLNHFWCQTTARFAKSKYCATLMSQTKLWGSQIDSFRIEILSLIFDSLAAVGVVLDLGTETSGGWGIRDASTICSCSTLNPTVGDDRDDRWRRWQGGGASGWKIKDISRVISAMFCFLFISVLYFKYFSH